MYIKIINPVKDGLKIYNNSGSCAQVSNYLVQEKENKGEKADFFNNVSDNLTKDEVNTIMDNNIKGLKAEDDKFINIAINPSDEELKHIGNDKEKLKEYTKQVMREYAENFQLKNTLTSNDLVWVATIHNDRHFKHNEIYYSETDFKKDGIPKGDTKPGMENNRVGDKKPGFNTHIHVIVSCRDREMKTTLNPLKSRQGRFSIYNLSAKTNMLFAEKYEHQKTLTNYKAFINKQYGNRAIRKFDQVGKRVEFYINKNEFKDYLVECNSKKAAYDALCSVSREKSTSKEFPTAFVFRYLTDRVKEFEQKDILLYIPDKLEKEIKQKENVLNLNLTNNFYSLSMIKDDYQEQDYYPILIKKKKRKRGLSR